jgi:hypothetical protein
LALPLLSVWSSVFLLQSVWNSVLPLLWRLLLPSRLEKALQ